MADKLITGVYKEKSRQRLPARPER